MKLRSSLKGFIVCSFIFASVLIVYIVYDEVALQSSTKLSSPQVQPTPRLEKSSETIKNVKRTPSFVPDNFDYKEAKYSGYSDEVIKQYVDYYVDTYQPSSSTKIPPITSVNSYNSSGGYTNIYCFNNLNSCSAYDSDGNYANIYCSSSLNSCSAYGSNGNYSNTYYSPHTNSSSTYNSDGGYSNTYYSPYTNSSSTYDSNGNYTNTYCSNYTNSCSSYDSNGNYTNHYFQP